MQTNAFVKHNRSREKCRRKRHNGGHGSDFVNPFATVEFRATEGLRLADTGSSRNLRLDRIAPQEAAT